MNNDNIGRFLVDAFRSGYMVARMKLFSVLLAVVLVGVLEAGEITLLNVSYDPTREFYADYNEAFAKYWKEKTGDTVTVNQSHGGSSKQARAVIDGLEADVVTLALAADVDALYENGKLVPQDWQERLPHNSAPYQSTLSFLVRKGNPKGIKDWEDLIKPGVEVITPNPKTSGAARWTYLAGWGFALKKYGSQEKAKQFITELFKHVPVLDSGARGATTTFVERGLGDVLINWENELLLVKKLRGDEFEIVVPSVSILAEPTVAVVDKIVDKRGTREVATEYLTFLYSDTGQEIAAKHFFRPSNNDILAKYASQYPKLELFTINDVFGGWTKATKDHFVDGASFDQIYSGATANK